MKPLQHQSGQSMVEFNIALPFMMPIMLVIMMLIVQWAFIYSAKSTLDAATANAVREGTLNNGSLADIRQGLARGMMPLYANGTTPADTFSALARAVVATRVQSQITILNPNRSVFNRFRVRSRINGRNIYEIPNNNLMYRNPAPLPVDGNRRINIQDANLLQIEVRWCQRLIVPVANVVIREIVTDIWFRPSRDQLACNALGLVTGDVYLAMTSQGLARMQTPFRM
ncbi:pilus assembly protein [Shewanella corallii]|uniref:Pilus assembly protein n=1 Tax=Shewanella corallii TaxID=560080 RepID=A0ABT0N607_9GAMM|nr:TadE family protein [Shewanella corallii]MCL2913869.1 pilus assembly protein [Shewanella corallii]